MFWNYKFCPNCGRPDLNELSKVSRDEPPGIWRRFGCENCGSEVVSFQPEDDEDCEEDEEYWGEA